MSRHDEARALHAARASLREDCGFCAVGWPMCPACAELTDGGNDLACPHCSDSKGHVSPAAHADFLALVAEGAIT